MISAASQFSPVSLRHYSRPASPQSREIQKQNRGPTLPTLTKERHFSEGRKVLQKGFYFNNASRPNFHRATKLNRHRISHS